jgi:hypothetical protein
VKAIDGLGENPGAGGFAHTAWTTKQISMCQMMGGNGILEGCGQ